MVRKKRYLINQFNHIPAIFLQKILGKAQKYLSILNYNYVGNT